MAKVNLKCMIKECEKGASVPGKTVLALVEALEMAVGSLKKADELYTEDFARNNVINEAIAKIS